MRGFLFSFCMILFSSLSFANQQSLYGLGANAQSLGNSNSALPLDAYSQNYNPGLMQFQKGSLFSFSMEGAMSSFNSISQVQTCTTALYGGCTQSNSDVNTKTADTFLAALGFKTPLGHGEHPMNVGFFIVAPLQQLMEVNTENSFLPQYSMYLADTQYFTGGMNLSFSLGDSWAFGLGGQLYLTMAGNAQFELPTGGNSTGQVKLDARPGFAPTVGVIKSFNDAGIKVGASYFGVQNGQFVLNQSAAIGLLPGGTGAPLAFAVNSSVMFNPETYVLSTSYQNDIESLSFSANIERWSGYQSSQIVINFQTFQSTFSQTLPLINFHDTISLHGGFQRKWQAVAARIGYAFVPTPTPDLSGDLNFMDSDKHEVGLGFSILNLEKALGFKSQLDFAGLVHYLMPRQVTKNSSASLGYPGYKIGGTVWSYGITLTTEL